MPFWLMICRAASRIARWVLCARLSRGESSCWVDSCCDIMTKLLLFFQTVFGFYHVFRYLSIGNLEISIAFVEHNVWYNSRSLF